MKRKNQQQKNVKASLGHNTAVGERLRKCAHTGVRTWFYVGSYCRLRTEDYVVQARAQESTLDSGQTDLALRK